MILPKHFVCGPTYVYPTSIYQGYTQNGIEVGMHMHIMCGVSHAVLMWETESVYHAYLRGVYTPWDFTG